MDSNCNYYKCTYSHPKYLSYCLSCKRFYNNIKSNSDLPILIDKYEDSTFKPGED